MLNFVQESNCCYDVYTSYGIFIVVLERTLNGPWCWRARDNQRHFISDELIQIANKIICLTAS